MVVEHPVLSECSTTVRALVCAVCVGKLGNLERSLPLDCSRRPNGGSLGFLRRVKSRSSCLQESFQGLSGKIQLKFELQDIVVPSLFRLQVFLPEFCCETGTGRQSICRQEIRRDLDTVSLIADLRAIRQEFEMFQHEDIPDVGNRLGYKLLPPHLDE